MSGEVVNLRQVRKAKARTEKEKIADQNRVSFGRSKAEKNLTRALNDKARAALDNSKLEPKLTSPAPDEQG
ncbi:DUF4169 family protein [Agrobacterium vitis]|uniref:DUF4169 family protein n=1 Tax=Rhizobium/Agrobacterium group TaxID=227290 RepID=UPI0008DC2C2E|nr:MULTISPECIES: DUF4169 family protein [Rhizobium/Agrobacterium group]MCF1433237.1 DUF4169 family protein [Allorhizobium ampelinum]MUO90908.1 DUF4169 family protein [Agrobacterium vitis]MUZ54802.1 DUF4169 family protein [Agrobacterium vitis]MUZ93074.1 DUF4169 family protein [Agrobacterium vitis]MVA41403.1 DUF4169 family protein [Agrobacterium vitis]